MEQTISIDELVQKARKFILDCGYTAEYRYAHHWIWKKFNLYAKATHKSMYSSELGLEFYCKWLGYASIAATVKKDEYKLRAMRVLDDIYHDRPLKRKYLHNLVHIPECFRAEHDAYLRYLANNEQKPRTIATKSSRVLVFLRYLEKESVMLSDFNFHIVERFYAHISNKYNKTAQANIKFTVRDFLKFCGTEGLVPDDSDRFVGTIYGNKHERLPSTYTKE